MIEKEEAIKIFQDKIKTMEHEAICCDYGNDKDAFLLAIQLLKQEPCEDAISRQAAIDAIYARYIGGKEAVDKAPANDQYAEGIDEAVCAVEDLPPVTPQPKSECEHDHEILKAYSDGASAVLDKVRAEIMNLQTYKMFEGEDAVYVERENVLQIIDEFTGQK